MRIAPAPVSDLRLKRLHRWAMLWLTWVLGFLDVVARGASLPPQVEAVAHRWLGSLEHLVVDIVLIRAAARVRPLRHPCWTARSGCPSRRAILGCALRRVLRDSDVRARIAALRQNIEALVARLARRLPRGLTRRRCVVIARPAHAPRTQRAAGLSLPAMDTS